MAKIFVSIRGLLSLTDKATAINHDAVNEFRTGNDEMILSSGLGAFIRETTSRLHFGMFEQRISFRAYTHDFLSTEVGN